MAQASGTFQATPSNMHLPMRQFTFGRLPVQRAVEHQRIEQQNANDYRPAGYGTQRRILATSVQERT